jgi:cell division protein FtsB
MKASLPRFAYAIALLLVASYAYFALRGPKGLSALADKRAEIRELERRNEELVKQIERKREHIRRLNDNPAEQELEIRERLKLVHPNEKVYIIGSPAKN